MESAVPIQARTPWSKYITSGKEPLAVVPIDLASLWPQKAVGIGDVTCHRILSCPGHHSVRDL